MQALVRATARIASLELSLAALSTENERMTVAVRTHDTTQQDQRQREQDEQNKAQSKEREEAIRTTQAALRAERIKRTQYKQLAVRLRLELASRRLKEKWELGIMDAEDRQRDIASVVAEFDAAGMRMRIGLEGIERDELRVSTLHMHTRTLARSERLTF